MCSLQLSNTRSLDLFHFPGSFSPWANRRRRVENTSFLWGGLSANYGSSVIKRKCCPGNRSCLRVSALSSSNVDGTSFKMNLQEYMVTLEKPLGIRFALSVDGKIFVHALRKGGNADKSRIILVGDTLKKAGESSGERLFEMKDFGDTEILKKENAGSFSLVFERPYSPFPLNKMLKIKDLDILFNRSRVPVVTWNNNILASNVRTSDQSHGNPGFITFNSKFLNSKGWKHLNAPSNSKKPKRAKNNNPAELFSPIVALFSFSEPSDSEWAHGSFPLDEYVKALDRAEGELYYNHSLGMCYSKITEQIFLGSCIQTEADVETLSSVAGVTAVLNFQSKIEAVNWGINTDLINDACQKYQILMIHYPIREGDSFDARQKLPFCVGLLLRLLRKNHRVFVSCTTGLDRSPACVIAYLHWVTDTSLNAAYNFVTGFHSCKPNRAAIAWATWDLIAMVSSGDMHEGPATHAVTFVWNGSEGDEVFLVGDFTGNWKEPIKTVHKGGPRYEVEVKLPQGKYYYKYIVNGQWRHSTTSPIERDQSGNINNIIAIGDIASVRPSAKQPEKDANIVKVIERQLTENERFLLAKASRCVGFSVCPIRLSPK